MKKISSLFYSKAYIYSKPQYLIFVRLQICIQTLNILKQNSTKKILKTIRCVIALLLYT